MDINLKNGSLFKVKYIKVVGTLTDSNGLEVGGNTEFKFDESEIEKLNQSVALQQVYNAMQHESENEDV